LLLVELKRTILRLYVDYCFSSIKRRDPRAFEIVRRGVKRKITMCLLRNGNDWMSISEIAREIGVSKATVQDHLEVMLREGILEDMRIMNRRLFKIREEVFSPFPPLSELALALLSASFLVLYVVFRKEILLGVFLGMVFSIILIRFFDKLEAA